MVGYHCKKIKTVNNIKHFIKRLREDKGIYPYGFVGKKVPAHYVTGTDFIRLNEEINFNKVKDFLRDKSKDIVFKLNGLERVPPLPNVKVKKMTLFANKAKHVRFDIKLVDLLFILSSLLEDEDLRPLKAELYEITEVNYEDEYALIQAKPYIFLDKLNHFYVPEEIYIFTEIRNKQDFYNQGITEFSNYVSKVSNNPKKILFFASAFLFFIDKFHQKILEEKQIRMLPSGYPDAPDSSLFEFKLRKPSYGEEKISIFEPYIRYYEKKQHNIIVKSRRSSLTLFKLISNFIHSFLTYYLVKHKSEARDLGITIREILNDEYITFSLNLIMLKSFVYYIHTYLDIIDMKKFLKLPSTIYFLTLVVAIKQESIVITDDWHSGSFSFDLPRTENSFLEDLLKKIRKNRSLKAFAVTNSLKIISVKETEEFDDFIFMITRSLYLPRLVLLHIKVPLHLESLYLTMSLLSGDKNLSYSFAYKIINLSQKQK